MTKWRKSSHSGMTEDSSCVEVARLRSAIGLRDSKDPHGPRLSVPAETFARLLARVKQGELNI